MAENEFVQNQTTGRLDEKDDLMKETSSEASFYWQMSYPTRASVGSTPGSSKSQKTAQGLMDAGGYGPAPTITPIAQRPENGDAVDKNAVGPSKIINVRDDHHWTESPISSRGEVPKLNLKEYRILTNPALNQMLHMINGAQAATGAALESVNKLIENIGGVVDFDDLSKKFKQSVSSGNVAAGDELLGQSTAYMDPLKPYGLLYSTIPTKFKYVLPYMQDRYMSTSGGFGEQASAGVIADTLSKAAFIALEGMQQISMNKMLSPGRMIEEPKGFSFEGREKEYTVSFPLLNTKSYTEIVKNWQFLYLLAYQNTPNRVSRDLIDPPCIYECYIPGVWYSKYAAITNMTVDFVGARREMNIPVKTIEQAQNGNTTTDSGNWKQVPKKTKAVIPDAYQVTVTIRELFSETQNFKYHMLRESMNDVITTGTIST